jgi:hypothetical protein
MVDKEKAELARKFFNDSFTFNQLGCSSPQMIFVSGNENDNMQFLKEIYVLLEKYANTQYDQDIYSLASLKFNFLAENILDDKIFNIMYKSNYLIFAEVREYEGMNKSCGAGFFYIKQIDGLAQLSCFITKKIQTLSYFGFSSQEINQIAEISYSLGIDRIVPVGNALNFDYIWDGYNLLDELCNKKRIILT